MPWVRETELPSQSSSMGGCLCLLILIPRTDDRSLSSTRKCVWEASHSAPCDSAAPVTHSYHHGGLPGAAQQPGTRGTRSPLQTELRPGPAGHWPESQRPGSCLQRHTCGRALAVSRSMSGPALAMTAHAWSSPLCSTPAPCFIAYVPLPGCRARHTGEAKEMFIGGWLGSAGSQ